MHLCCPDPNSLGVSGTGTGTSHSWLAFASLKSLGQDKTFKSLESLVRLFQKVLKLIIL